MRSFHIRFTGNAHSTQERDEKGSVENRSRVRGGKSEEVAEFERIRECPGVASMPEPVCQPEGRKTLATSACHGGVAVLPSPGTGGKKRPCKSYAPYRGSLPPLAIPVLTHWATSLRPSGFHCRAPKPHDPNADAPLDAAHERLFEEVGKPLGCLLPALCLLQFLPDSQEPARYACDGSWYFRSGMDNRRTFSVG